MEREHGTTVVLQQQKTRQQVPARLLIAATLSLSSIDQSQVLRQTLSLSLGPQHLQAGPILDQLQTENTDREGQTKKYNLVKEIKTFMREIILLAHKHKRILFVTSIFPRYYVWSAETQEYKFVGKEMLAVGKKLSLKLCRGHPPTTSC